MTDLSIKICGEPRAPELMITSLFTVTENVSFVVVGFAY